MLADQPHVAWSHSGVPRWSRWWSDGNRPRLWSCTAGGVLPQLWQALRQVCERHSRSNGQSWEKLVCSVIWFAQEYSWQYFCCCCCLGESYSPKLGVVVVQKRISTRLFYDAHQLQNPPPGTVMDHTVTRCNRCVKHEANYWGCFLVGLMSNWSGHWLVWKELSYKCFCWDTSL